MTSWSAYPMVRLIIPFIAGIIAAVNLPGWGVMLLFPVTLIFAIFLIITFNKDASSSYRIRWVPGLIVSLCVFILAYQYTSIRQEDSRAGLLHYNAEASGKALYIGMLTQPPAEKPKSLQTIIRIIAIINEQEKAKSCKVDLLAYFQKNSSASYLKYGDLILFSAKIQPVSGMDNPHGFDYGRYMSFKGIYYQVFIDDEGWKKIGSCGNPMIHLAWKSRITTENTLKKFGIHGNELAVAIALLIGGTELLDDEIKRNFSYAGVMHVLCVSGMHVGVVFVMLNIIFFQIGRVKHGRLMKSLLILLGIWSYALITGLSASVLRASFMFSLVLVGKNFRRQIEIYNTLAASALILLVINPLLVMQAGFQLSYLAVLGIVAFQKKFYRLWTTSWWLTDKTWSLIAVSVAAQMGTFPLSVGLFGFIPTWFLAANLIVIPLSAIIIYLGVALLILSSLPLIPDFLAASLNFCLRLMNSSVAWIQSWPASIIRPVYMTRLEELCCYLIILGIFLFINKKIKTAIILTTVAAIMWTSLLISRCYDQYSGSQMTIYNILGGFAIDFFIDKKCFSICDSALYNDNARTDRFAGPNRVANGIRQIENIVCGENVFSESKVLYSKGPFIFFSGKKIVLIDDNWQPRIKQSGIKVNYIILAGNPMNLKVEELVRLFNPDIVIISSASPRFLSDKWSTQCRERNIPCHSIPDSGAYVIKCN